MLSEAIHPAMVADADNTLVHDLGVCGGTDRIVDHYGRSTALDYMNGDIVSATQCQDLWFAAPYSSVAYGSAILLKFARRHEAWIGGASAVFAGYGR